MAAASGSLPSGTVTFLFTDIQGSTVRWDRAPHAMRDAVRRHDATMRATVGARGGAVFKTIGDAFCVAFEDASDAVAAALDAQRALAALDFDAVGGLRVRMALHAGTCDERDGDYFGPTLNRVARLLAIGNGGQILASSAVAEIAAGRLPDGAELRDLGEHRLKDLTRAERVHELVAPSHPASSEPLRSLSVLRNNLPLQLEALVGREAFARDVVAALASARLVTLAGPGGVGKTRLAVHVAADLLDGSGDGVWFVDLAPLASGSLVAPTIAADLGIALTAGRDAMATLVEALRARRQLVVLDNCEHVVADAARIVAAILRGAPDVKILATSREALAIAGERVLHVPSLDVPPPGPLGASEALRYDAVALFADRARALDARFALSDANAPIVADIVRRLDGIALAIELAAARVKILGVSDLARRLDARFRILTGGSRTALPRQRTMHALVSWSWDLLDAREQTLFRRLAIFAGGWTLEAAEAVCGDDALDAFDVAELLGSLLDKSLVASDGDPALPRGRLLETMRAFALEKLDAAGEREAVAAAHAAWVARFAERLQLAYDGAAAWFATLGHELDNARAALTWTLANERAAEAATIVLNAFCGYWWYRAPSEGLAWARRVLDGLGPGDGATAAALHAVCGSYLTGRRCIEAYARSVELYEALRASGDRSGARDNLGYSLSGLGQAQFDAGFPHDALATIERGIAVQRADGKARTRAFAGTLINRGSALAGCDRLDEARREFDAAIDLFGELEERPGVAYAMLARASVEYAAGDWEAARSQADAAGAIGRELGLTVDTAKALTIAAATAWRTGDRHASRRTARDAMREAARAGIEPPLELVLLAALVAASAGDGSTAARLAQAVDAATERSGDPPGPVARDLRRVLDDALAATDGRARAAPLRAGYGALAAGDVRAVVERLLVEAAA